MKTKSTIQQEVDRCLASLDGMQLVDANPYLFTQIEARLDHLALRRSQPKWQWAALAVVVLLNLSVAMQSLNHTAVAEDEEISMTHPLVMEFAISNSDYEY